MSIKKFNHVFVVSASILGFNLTAGSATAAFISPVGAVDVGATPVFGAVGNTISTVGLSSLSGTATHAAGTDTFVATPAANWTIQLDLGGDFNLTDFYLWDNDDGGGGDDVSSFRLDFYQDGGLIGTTGATASITTSAAPIPVEAYAISPGGPVDRVDFVMLANFGGGGASISELAFEGTEFVAPRTPEPSTLMLVAIGLVGLVARRRRTQS